MNLKPIQKKVEFDIEAFDSTLIRDYSNCYSYALNLFDIETKMFVGVFSGYDNEYLIDDIKLANRFIKDMICLGKNPQKTDLVTKTKKGYYKVALFSNYGNNSKVTISDFHFVRQDEDGNWSHKVKCRAPERINPQEFQNLRICGDEYHLVGIFLIKKR